jgi:IclR family pca regulon transcriptional regulator
MPHRRGQPLAPSPVVEDRLSIPTLREPRYSQSLERGLAILAIFTPERQVLGIAEVADELGMQRSTTHRYMSTLVVLGYLEQDQSRKYRLGLRVTDLGMSALNSTDLREHARPYLAELSRLSYPISLAVLDGPEIVCVDRVHCPRSWQMVDRGPPPGSRLPVYCTAMGKLLLAHLPKETQDQVIGEMTLKRRTSHTITSKEVLREELEEIREGGFAVNDQELEAERHAIAVAVRSETEVVAALSMTAHVSMIGLDELMDALGPHLLTAADRISARLGYRREDEINPAHA